MTTKEKFTAKDVQTLRQRTGAGMMESKKALEETGDMEKAIEYLRTKGIAKAEKRVGKQTSEGMVNLLLICSDLLTRTCEKLSKGCSFLTWALIHTHILLFR